MLRIYVPDHGHVVRRKFCTDNGIGMLYSPHRQNLPLVGDFIVDNGAYPAWKLGELLDVEKFVAFLDKVRARGRPYFAVIPDIVRGGRRSFEFSVEHITVIQKDVPKYFVVNPAISEHDLRPYFEEIDGLFISLATFTRERDIRQYVTMGHDHGLPVHIGQAGTARSYTLALETGADSCDGSGPMRHNELDLIVNWRLHTKEQQKIRT
jgi:hypothetical protein